jgi:hypothetical protein
VRYGWGPATWCVLGDGRIQQMWAAQSTQLKQLACTTNEYNTSSAHLPPPGTGPNSITQTTHTKMPSSFCST